MKYEWKAFHAQSLQGSLAPFEYILEIYYFLLFSFPSNKLATFRQVYIQRNYQRLQIILMEQRLEHIAATRTECA